MARQLLRISALIGSLVLLQLTYTQGVGRRTAQGDVKGSTSAEDDGDEKFVFRRQSKLESLRRLSGGNYIQPRETLFLLREVNGTKFDHFEAQKLIQIWNVTVEKCDKSYLEDELSNVLRQVDNFRKTLVPYIEYCRKRQLSLCKRTLVPRLKQVIGSLSKDVVDDVTILMKKINPPNKLLEYFTKATDLSVDNIIESAAHFIETKEQEYAENKIQFKYLDELYDNLEPKLTKRCESINSLLGPFLYVYRQVGKVGLEGQTWSWMLVARLCERITNDFKIIYKVGARWAQSKSTSGQQQLTTRD